MSNLAEQGDCSTPTTTRKLGTSRPKTDAERNGQHPVNHPSGKARERSNAIITQHTRAKRANHPLLCPLSREITLKYMHTQLIPPTWAHELTAHPSRPTYGFPIRLWISPPQPPQFAITFNCATQLHCTRPTRSPSSPLTHTPWPQPVSKSPPVQTPHTGIYKQFVTP